MANSSHPLAFMLRCRQASLFTSLCRLRNPPQKLQAIRQTRRAASTTTQSPVPPPPVSVTTPTERPFPFRSPHTPQPLPRGSYFPTSHGPTQIRTAQPLKFWTTTIKSVFGWKPTPAPYMPAPFNAINNPYRARKKWPPDFTTLHPKHQFHFEKTYRRRSKLKYLRPRWIKGTKIVQFTLTVVIVLYWIFYLEVEGKEGTLFDGVSHWILVP